MSKGRAAVVKIMSNLYKKCPLPPPGWHCKREPGHSGPCPAMKTDDYVNWLEDRFASEVDSHFETASMFRRARDRCDEYKAQRDAAVDVLTMVSGSSVKWIDIVQAARAVLDTIPRGEN